MQRYQWEDALIKAESAGTINSTAVNVALRLSSAINWAPKTNKPAGLYWANEEAAAAVNVSRASLYRALKVLKAAGFLVESKENLLPTLPESQIETSKSQIDTEKSQIETAESQIDNPFTEDIFTEDTCPEDSFKDIEPAIAADAAQAVSIGFDTFQPERTDSSLVKNVEPPLVEEVEVPLVDEVPPVESQPSLVKEVEVPDFEEETEVEVPMVEELKVPDLKVETEVPLVSKTYAADLCIHGRTQCGPCSQADIEDLMTMIEGL